MKRPILTICLSIIALGALAQSPISIRAKAGIGTSNLWGDNASSDTRIAYKTGIEVEYNLTKVWLLQSSLNFVSKGGKDNIDGVGKANMNELYIELPIMLAARLNLGKNYYASLGVGPYIAYGVGGKTYGESNDYSSSSYPSNAYHFRLDTFGSMQKGNMGNKRFDAGLSFGLSLEYHRFVVGAEAQVGFIQVNDEISKMIDASLYSKYSPKNLALFFTAGYKIWK